MEGTLRLNISGNYEVVSDDGHQVVELICGSKLQVLFFEIWLDGVVEFNLDTSKYQLTTADRFMTLGSGMKARLL